MRDSGEIEWACSDNGTATRATVPILALLGLILAMAAPAGASPDDELMDVAGCFTLATAKKVPSASDRSDAAIEFVCEKIVAARSNRLSGPAVIVDFKDFQGVRPHSKGRWDCEGRPLGLPKTVKEGGLAFVPAAPIARLLAVKDIVPSHFTHGLIFSNFAVDGAFLLKNARVTVPVAFNGVTFLQSAAEHLDSGSCQTSAIYLDGVRFEKKLTLSNVKVHGFTRISNSRFDSALWAKGASFEAGSPSSPIDVLVLNSTFRKGLFWLGSEFGVTSESAKKVAQQKGEIEIARSGMVVSGSVVEGNLHLSSNSFAAALKVQDNEIGGLLVGGSDFKDGVTIESNEIGNVNITNSNLNEDFFFRSNDVAGSAFIQNVFLLRNDPEDPAKTEVAANRISGGLHLRPWEMADDSRVDLSFNVVLGPSDFWIPEQTGGGSIDLRHSRFESSLNLGRSHVEDDGSRWLRDPIYRGSDDVCAEGADQERAITLNLSGANIGNLEWGLDLDCAHHLWRGAGLAFDHWRFADFESGRPASENAQSWRSSPIPPVLAGPASNDQEPDRTQVTSKAEIQRFLDWRELLVGSDVSARLTMANYLQSLGQFTLSRRLREEAKRLNYTDLPEDPSVWEWSVAQFIRVALWPGGYGARPERALIMVIGGMLAFWLFYRWYSRESAGGWDDDESEVQRSKVAGFNQHDQAAKPEFFRLWQYSVDTMVPLINLHAYSRYYAEDRRIRLVALAQHILGWWWFSIFAASATVL